MNVKHIIELKNAKNEDERKRIIEENKDDKEFIKLLFYTSYCKIPYDISIDMLDLTDEDMKLIFSNAIKAAPFEDIFSCLDHLSVIRKIDGATLRQVKLFLYRFCTKDEREVYSSIITDKYFLRESKDLAKKLL